MFLAHKHIARAVLCGLVVLGAVNASAAKNDKREVQCQLSRQSLDSVGKVEVLANGKSKFDFDGKHNYLATVDVKSGDIEGSLELQAMVTDGSNIEDVLINTNAYLELKKPHVAAHSSGSHQGSIKDSPINANLDLDAPDWKYELSCGLEEVAG